MSQSDLDINRMVRSVLVKHWIDLGRLSLRSNDGKLYIRGSLMRISGTNEELTTAIVDAMFEEFARIKNVKQIYPALENWNNDAGRWVQTGSMKVSQKAGQQTDVRTTEIYDIKKPGDQ